MLDEQTTEANDGIFCYPPTWRQWRKLDMQISLTPHGGIGTCCEVKACFGKPGNKWEKIK